MNKILTLISMWLALGENARIPLTHSELLRSTRLQSVKSMSSSSASAGHYSEANFSNVEPELLHMVELPVSSLTLNQLQYQLKIRGIEGVGSQAEMMQALVRALSSCGHKRHQTVKTQKAKPVILDIQCLRYDIDAYISAATASITLSQFHTLLSIVREPTVFGEGRMLAVSALAHNVWSTMSLTCRKSRMDFLDSLEAWDEDNATVNAMAYEDVLDVELSKIAARLDFVQLLRAADAAVAENFHVLQNEMNACCRRMTSKRPPALKLQEYPKLLHPLKDSADPPASALLPFLIALRSAGVVDGTLGCGASPAERAEANHLEVLFGAWVDRRPWVQDFLDLP